MTLEKPSRLAAIVGCGGIAGGYDEAARDNGVYTHAGAYRARAPRVKLVACVEPDPGRRSGFQQFWGIEQAYATLEAMLDRVKVDIVSVCSPDTHHAAQLRAIVRSRKTRIIWAEKPLTTTKSEAEAVVRGAREAGIGIRLSNQRRWEPAHRTLAGELADGMIGTIRAVRGYYVKGVTHIGTTMINTLRMLVGDIEHVQAVEPFETGCYPDDPSLAGVLWFRGGASGMIHGVDGDRYRYSVFEIEIVGTDGRVRVLRNGDDIEVERPKPYGHYEGFVELEVVERRQSRLSEAMVLGLDRMLEALDRDDAADVSEADEGVRDLSVVDALRESARLGGVRLSTRPC